MMRLDTLKYFYEKAAGQNPSFYYRGPLLEKFTNTILEVSNGSSAKSGLEGIGKKVSYMLVECFQNVLKHGETKENTEHQLSDSGLFSFKNTPGAFIINSINLIQNQDIPRLSGLVEQINAMSEADLKQFYLENLKNNNLSEKGGAGLGLIEMARKSGQKILHRMDDINGNISFFNQQITIRRPQSEDLPYEVHLEDSADFYKRMTDENLLLMYKGDFSQKSILPLLELAEHNIRDKSIDGRRTLRAAHVTVEVLQNISKHSKIVKESDSRFGIFLLGNDKNGLSILAGNVVSEQEKQMLSDKLDYLLSLDEDELRELHRNTLVATLRFESKSNSGLGLIEVAQATNHSLKYKFFPHGDNQYLFVLQATI
jgi:hypothetical protein